MLLNHQQLDAIEIACRTLLPLFALSSLSLICLMAVHDILNWSLLPRTAELLGYMGIIVLLCTTACCAIISLTLSVNRIADQLYQTANRINQRITHY